MQRINHGELSLTILKRPTGSDMDLLENGYQLHPLIISEVSRFTLHPKIEHYHNHALVIFHFPHFDRAKKELRSSEVDFILTPQELILVQYDDLEPLDQLIKQLAEETGLREDFFSGDIGLLLYKILNQLFHQLFPQLDHIIKKVDHLEDTIFQGADEELVSEISLLRREAMSFKRIIQPNVEILQEIAKYSNGFFTPQTAPYFSNLMSINQRLASLIENETRTLEILHQTNTALLSNKISKVMRLLTIFSVIVFPLTLFATLFAMRTEVTPIIGQRGDFWIIIGIMSAITLAMLGWFKEKHWL